MKKTILIILGILVIVGIAGGGYYLWQKNILDKEKTTLENQINNQKNQATETPKTTNTTINLNCPENYKEYISQNLGVGFCYPEKLGDTQIIKVTEEGNKIFLYDQKMKKESGQSVEVFNKIPSDSLVAGIEKALLQGVSKDKCWALSEKASEISGFIYPDNYVFAKPLQYYTQAELDKAQGYEIFNNSGNCPEGYGATNGIRYFMMDQNHSDRFLFFNIGQYSIGGINEPAWQETIKVFDPNLKFYESDSLGISFYYNPNFEIKNFEGTLTLSDKTKKIESVPAGYPQEKYVSPSFQISFVGDYSNINDFIDPKKNITIVEDCKNIMISSNRWYECVIGGYGAYKVFVIEKNQKMLKFSSETREYEMIKDDMRKALETIEFLN